MRFPLPFARGPGLSGGLAAAALLMVLGLGRAPTTADEPPADAPAPPPPAAAPDPARERTASRLVARLDVEPEGEPGPLGEHDFRLALTLSNPGEAPLSVVSGQLLLRSPGGWLSPLEPAGLAGTYLKDTALSARTDLRVDAQPYKVLGPALDAVVSLEVSDGHAFFCAPIRRASGETPPPCPAPAWPMGLGVVGPLEAVPYSDGRRSIVVVGQLQSLGAGQLTQVEGSVLVGSGGGAGLPVTWSGGAGDGTGPGLWPFVQRVDVGNDLTGGVVSVRVKALLDGAPVSAALDLEARAVEPWRCLGPVRNAWHLGNGPAERQVHANLLQLRSRYAWDFVIMVDGRTYEGDPTLLRSYKAFERPVYAVADGEVVDLCVHQPDRMRTQSGAAPCTHTPVNRIVLRHDDGTHTAYLHLMEKSAQDGVRKGARVKAGQAIARIGNSGASSEPHLQFFAFRPGPDGTLVPVPVAFTNAFHDAAATQPVVGVPVGGETLQFAEPPR